MKQIDILIAVLSAITFVLCNAGSKMSLSPNRAWVMYIVYTGAILAYWLFRKLCENNGLAISSGIVDSLITIICILVGLIFFQEALTTKQYIGIVLLLVGLHLVR